MNANAPRFNSDAIDHTIDRALSALRDAQPRPGLEGRILASLEHRTAAPQPVRFHISAHVTLWTAASAALLAIASMTILHYRVVRAPQNAVILSERSESKNPDGIRHATNPKPFSTTNLAQNSNTLSSRPEHRSLAAMRSGETGVPGQLAGRGAETPVFGNCSNHPGCPVHDDESVATTPSDAQLLADLHAPSHPAPPLPLTPQEKLFLRLLRYGNATQLAELNPMVRAKQDADETTAFKSFFPDPPPLQQPTGDSE
jgi:hypothetical protein